MAQELWYTTEKRSGATPNVSGTAPELLFRAVGLTGLEPAIPWPPVTFGAFATDRACPVCAAQRRTTSVSVRSDSPPFRARCCTGCCITPPRPGVLAGWLLAGDLGCRHSSPPTDGSPRRPRRPTATAPPSRRVGHLGGPHRAPSHFPSAGSGEPSSARSRESSRCRALQPAAWMMARC